jgi:hypothetical protein
MHLAFYLSIYFLSLVLRCRYWSLTLVTNPQPTFARKDERKTGQDINSLTRSNLSFVRPFVVSFLICSNFSCTSQSSLMLLWHYC